MSCPSESNASSSLPPKTMLSPAPSLTQLSSARAASKSSSVSAGMGTCSPREAMKTSSLTSVKRVEASSLLLSCRAISPCSLSLFSRSLSSASAVHACMHCISSCTAPSDSSSIPIMPLDAARTPLCWIDKISWDTSSCSCIARCPVSAFTSSSSPTMLSKTSSTYFARSSVSAERNESDTELPSTADDTALASQAYAAACTEIPA